MECLLMLVSFQQMFTCLVCHLPILRFPWIKLVLYGCIALWHWPLFVFTENKVLYMVKN